MTQIMGKIKIYENKIILKTSIGSETYVKTKYSDVKKWIEYKGEVYQLDTVELEDSDDN